MPASAPSTPGSSSSVVMSPCSQRTLGARQEGMRRAKPTISPTRGSPPSAPTTLVPTLPVAPVTTTRMLMVTPLPTRVAPGAYEGSDLAWNARRTCGQRPGSDHRGTDGRDHQGDLDGDLRQRPAPLRGPRPLPGRGRRARSRADGD